MIQYEPAFKVTGCGQGNFPALDLHTVLRTFPRQPFQAKRRDRGVLFFITTLSLAALLESDGVVRVSGEA